VRPAPRWRRSLSLTALLLVALLLTTSTASAAEVQGHDLGYGPAAARFLSLHSADGSTSGDVTLVMNCENAPCGTEWTWRAARSEVDPRTLADGGQAMTAPIPGTMFAGSATSEDYVTLTWPTQALPGTGDYLSAYATRPGATYLVAAMKLGAATPTTTPPAPTTTPPATTTTPPTSTTTPSTTTTPPSPSDPTTGTGSTLSCVESQPCYVRVLDGVTVDVESLEVSAMTEEQWATIQLALGSLVFFTAAGFVYSWRRGRA
jgi:hypothetical protein